MIKEYAIISINEDRAAKKKAIREALPSMTEVCLQWVDGKNALQLSAAKTMWPFPIHKPFKEGEWGIWFSTLTAWTYAAENDGLILFEDDAIVSPEFERKLALYLEGAPDDIDFLALWTPDNQRQDYHYNVTYDEDGIPNIKGTLANGNSNFYFGHPFLAKAYQGYGGVALMVTKRGAQRLLEQVSKKGFNAPSDCFYFLEAHAGNINGYSIQPEYANLVSYDWSSPTTIHNTEMVNL